MTYFVPEIGRLSPTDAPMTPECEREVRDMLARLGYDDYWVDRFLRRRENERQERVRRSLGTRGKWGGEGQ